MPFICSTDALPFFDFRFESFLMVCLSILKINSIQFHSNRQHRQYYIYVTDPNCKRLGTQCWVYCAIMVSEAMLCIKNARELFERTQAVNIILWLLIQLIISIVFVYGCIIYHRYTPVIENTLFLFCSIYSKNKIHSEIKCMNFPLSNDIHD